MYAIIKTGGKQYRVAEGDFLKVETLNADVEGEVVFNEVLAVSTEEGLKVGTPVRGRCCRDRCRDPSRPRRQGPHFQVPPPQALHEERRPPSELHGSQDRQDPGLI